MRLDIEEGVCGVIRCTDTERSTAFIRTSLGEQMLEKIGKDRGTGSEDSDSSLHERPTPTLILPPSSRPPHQTVDHVAGLRVHCHTAKPLFYSRYLAKTARPYQSSYLSPDSHVRISFRDHEYERTMDAVILARRGAWCSEAVGAVPIVRCGWRDDRTCFAKH